jgi:hypothetical protein
MYEKFEVWCFGDVVNTRYLGVKDIERNEYAVLNGYNFYKNDPDKRIISLKNHDEIFYDQLIEANFQTDFYWRDSLSEAIRVYASAVLGHVIP